MNSLVFVFMLSAVAALEVAKSPWDTVPANAVRYGPSKCVAVYRDSQGHCVMQTQCETVKTSDYDFGLICVNDGVPTRHLFGKNSFDSKETFNTLIKCDKCIGLDGMSTTVRLRGIVTSLTKEVEGLKTEMLNLTTDLTKLNEKVLPKPKAAPAANATNTSKANVTAEAKAPAEEAKALLHHQATTASTHHKHHVRHAHHKHVAQKAPRVHHQRHHRAVVEEDEDNEQANELEAEDVQMEDEKDEEQQEEEAEAEEEEAAAHRHRKKHHHSHKKKHHKRHRAEEEQDEEALQSEQPQEEEQEKPQESKEAQGKELQAFHAMDKDGSGAVTKAEWMSSVSVVPPAAPKAAAQVAAPQEKKVAAPTEQKEVEDLD